MRNQQTRVKNPISLQIDTYMLEIPVTETILGRSGHPSEAQPDISLDRFGAQDKGVSRRHVRIRYGEDGVVLVTDLGSGNGTQINGERLKPVAEYRLRDGDTLTLGILKMIVRF